MSLSHCQELGQFLDLASELVVPTCVANQDPAHLLTQVLTMTTTHKFPSLRAHDSSACRSSWMA